MQLDIVARHFQLTDEQTEKIEAAFAKLERFSPRPVVEAKLTLTQERETFAADAALFLKNSELRAKADGAEPELAVADVIESLRKQLAKLKGRMSGRQRAEQGGLGRAMLLVEPEDVVSGTALEDVGLALADGESFTLRDMDVDSALRAFQDSELPFLVFRNVANARVAVVYRRRDGDLGLLESRQD
jgi:putative sigma-54 modulation protein